MGLTDWIKNIGKSKNTAETVEEAIAEDEARKRIADKKREDRIKQKEEELSNEEARGKGGSPFSFNVNIVKPNKGAFWVTLLLIIILFASWYFDFLNIRKTLAGFGLTIIQIIAVSVIVLFIGYGWTTCKDDIAKFYVATALFIWLVDLIPENAWFLGPFAPFLGPAWAGFDVYPLLQGIYNLSIFSIIFSAVFFSMLYINMIFNIIEKEHISTFLMFATILIIDYLTRTFFPNYANLNLGVALPRWTLALLILAFLALGYLAWRADKHKKMAIPNFFSSLYMIFVFSFFWLNNGWRANLRAIFHIGFILAYGFAYVKPKDPNMWRFLIPTILLVDFFGYGFLFNSDFLILKFISPIVLLTIIYCYAKESNEKEGKKKVTYPVAAFILLITFILIMSIRVSGLSSPDIPFVAKQGGSSFGDVFGKFSDNVKNFFSARLDYATGGYLSQVEKNQFEPLGVYFDKVKYAQPRFYSDEKVTLWATIKSRTLSDPVNINFTCFRYKNIATNTERISPDPNKDTVVPQEPFTVYTLEEKDVECTFGENQMQAGTNTITLSAIYNFATSAYQKTYFINNERLRAMTRESLDPLKEFGIADKTPATIYTNGPVELAVDVRYLISVGGTTDVSPAIGILLKNRDKISNKLGQPIGEWQGKIKKINELAIVVPKGITIDSDNCRPVKFKKIEKYDEYCTSSCRDAILNPCFAECGKFSSDTDPQIIAEKSKCVNDCSSSGDKADATKKCNEDCTSLFKGENNEENYDGYQLDIDELNKKTLDEFKDIDKFKTFLCRMIPTKDVLENVPITTKFIRVRSRYDYLLEKSYTVPVEQAPSPLADIIPFEDFDISPYITSRPSQEIYPGYPSNTDLDIYFKSKSSELFGIGQCIKDTEKNTGVPAIVILSVSNLESDKSGGQWKLSGLAQLNYNLFGIKCTDDYKNNICLFKDQKLCCRSFQSSPQNVYRAYPSYCESVKDFANLISKSKRYKPAMDYTNNPEEMVRKIGQAGYDDSAWSGKVISRMSIIRNDIQNSGTLLARTGGTT